MFPNDDFDGGMDITLRHTDVAKSNSVLKKLGSMYDEFAKLVFLFDCSGSMSSCVQASYTEQYVWTPAILAAIRVRVTNAISKLASDPLALIMGPSKDDAELLKLMDPGMTPGTLPTFTPNDEELKARIVKHDLIGFFNLQVDFTKSHEQPPTRMELVKKLAKSELQARFQKFPNSKIAVIPFGDQPVVMFDDGAAADLWPTLDLLKVSFHMTDCNGNIVATGGGTDILAAIRKAIDVCRAKPSPVGLHHFIIVSDGEDGGVNSTIGSWVPSLKASGVVMDYIHIGCENANDGLKAACLALGGEFVTVNSEKAFAEQFKLAVARLMLPAPVTT